MRHSRIHRPAVLWGTLFLAGAASLNPLQAGKSAGPEGLWIMNDGRLTVKLEYCGGKNLCATVADLKDKTDKFGRPRTDVKNPNPSLRTRPIIGLQVVNGMSPEGTNQWEGSIYNADDGKTYGARATIDGNNLVIKVCILGGLACKKRYFSRVN